MKHFFFRNGLVVLLCLCSFSCYAASMKRAKASSSLKMAMESYLDAAKQKMLNIQSVMVIQHGKVRYEKWLNGGEAEKPHVLNSVSKTFTSAAVGLAIEEGLLSLDDRLVSFFRFCPFEPFVPPLFIAFGIRADRIGPV